MTEKVPSLYPGRGTLTNKLVPKPITPFKKPLRLDGCIHISQLFDA